MLNSLYNYYLRQKKSDLKGFVRNRLFWYIYKFLKYALFRYYSIFFSPKIYGLNSSSDIIVSLTSLPSRIGSVHLTIKSIFNQSYLPNKIILWLGEEKFPNGYEDLPISLLELEKNGLEIKFCKDLGPHTKYFYAFSNYKNYRIVTVDDDLYYPRAMLNTLVKSSDQFQDSVIANRVREMDWEGVHLKPYRSWKINDTIYTTPSLKLFATGVGGVLYKPTWFSDDLYDIEAILKLCKNADDIWLKANQIKNGVTVFFTDYYSNPFIELPGSQKESLHKSNVFSGDNDDKITMTFKHFNINHFNDLKK